MYTGRRGSPVGLETLLRGVRQVPTDQYGAAGVARRRRDSGEGIHCRDEDPVHPLAVSRSVAALPSASGVAEMK